MNNGKVFIIRQNVKYKKVNNLKVSKIKFKKSLFSQDKAIFNLLLTNVINIYSLTIQL